MDRTDQRIRAFKRRAKRVFFAILLLTAVLVGVRHILNRYTSLLFLPVESDDIAYSFRCDGRDIQRLDGQDWRDFIVCGVELAASQNDADYETYARWLSDIAAMNANAVRVHSLMPADFYRALDDLNKDGVRLWLIQGVELSDETFSEMADLRSGEMVQLFRAESRRIIDALHGIRARSAYKTDVSYCTMAYIVGDHWDSDLVQYTDDVAKDIAGKYRGRYAYAWDSANATATLLAEVVDDLIRYETLKFSEQHIIGIGNTQNTDILFHDLSWAIGLNENNTFVNNAHVAPTTHTRTGVFAALRINTGVMQNLSFDPDYLEYKDVNGRQNPLRYYLDALYNALRHVPSMLGSTSMSASRGVSGYDEVLGFDRGGIGEEKQAEGLRFVFEQAVDAGFCGGFVGTYLDDPEATAWNASPYVNHNENWLDAQDAEQSLGLVALDPDENAICTVDGDASEWKSIPAQIDRDGALLQVAGDEEYLYLHVNIESYNTQTDVLYIPFDTTPLSGASKNTSQNLTFDRDMDFLLTINGKRRAKLTVQEYSEQTKSLNSATLDLKLYYVSPPAKNSDLFVDIVQYARPELDSMDGSEIPAVLADAGLLRYGNANPTADSYNSLADYCIGGDDIEIRLPWTLLNFTDPSSGSVLGDIYTLDAPVIQIHELYVGLHAYRDRAITDYSSVALALPCYEEAAYHERKRLAYDTMREVFSSFAS